MATACPAAAAQSAAALPTQLSFLLWWSWLALGEPNLTRVRLVSTAGITAPGGAAAGWGLQFVVHQPGLGSSNPGTLVSGIL